MKKTYTVTFHSAINYGAILQTIGLQKTLEHLGYSNYVIDYTDKSLYWYDPFNFKNLNFPAGIKKVLKLFLLGSKTVPKFKKFNKFINSNIRLTDKVFTKHDIESIIENDSVLITGSDQVWSSSILEGVSDIYTLNFGNNTHKRLSYAASIGVDKIDDKYVDDYKNKINNIDSISVREESARNILLDILDNKEIDVVLDPTLLLLADEWIDLSKGYDKKFKEKYIVAYTMDNNDEYVKIANYLSEKTGYKIVYFDLRNIGFKNILANLYSADPFEFINIIKNSEYVVTNSFHGTVFSLLFNKKLWVIPHLLKGTRMINLLEKVGLSNRIVRTLEEFKNSEFDAPIDYDNVNKLINEERDKSLNWLINSLKD